MGDGIKSTEELLSYPSFRRWARGKVSKPEAYRWDDWCRKSETNRKLAIEAQAELIGISPALSEQADATEEWYELYSHIKKMQSVKLNSHRKTPPLVWGHRLAVAFFVIAITLFFTMQWQQNKVQSSHTVIKWQEVSTTYSQQKKITLTDGSTIILSANSSIVYSDGWIQNSEVEINLQGEAYFDIPSRKSSGDPLFKVKTSDGTILVTGTRFVVDTDKERTRVIMEEGSVDIERNNREREVLSLHAEQLAEFNNEEVSLKRVNPEVYTSWIRQELVLDSTPLSFLTDKISRTYGVEVKVNDDALYNRKLTGTINFRSMERLLQAVSEVLQIEVTQTGDKVTFHRALK